MLQCYYHDRRLSLQSLKSSSYLVLWQINSALEDCKRRLMKSPAFGRSGRPIRNGLGLGTMPSLRSATMPYDSTSGKLFGLVMQKSSCDQHGLVAHCRQFKTFRTRETDNFSSRRPLCRRVAIYLCLHSRQHLPYSFVNASFLLERRLR